MSSVRTTSRERPQTFNGVKVFSASVHRHRSALGETVERWLAEHPEIRVFDFVVTQSSDASFHCISICVFYVFYRDLRKPSNVHRESGAIR